MMKLPIFNRLQKNISDVILSVDIRIRKTDIRYITSMYVCVLLSHVWLKRF